MGWIRSILRLQKLRDYAPLKVVAGVSCLSVIPFLFVELFSASLYRVIGAPSYLLVHNVIEFFSIMVSLSIFGVGWYTYGQSRDRHALHLSAAFLAIGLMDAMHALSYAGMPAFITPNSPNKATQFWIAVRTFGAVSFAVSAYVYPDSRRWWLSKAALAAGALGTSAAAFVGIVLFPERLPAAFVEGAGLTRFKIVAESLIVFLLLAATVSYWRRARRAGNGLVNHFMAALVVCVFSELTFILYKSVYDTFNLLGHVYKAAAFLVIYRGVFVTSIQRPYARLAEAGERLREDILRRKETEKALRDSERRLSLHLRQTMLAVIEWDPEFRVRDWNPAAEAMFGYTRAEAIGRHASELIVPPGAAAEVETRWGRLMARTGGTASIDESVTRAGKAIMCEWFNTPVVDDEGTVIGVMSFAREVTERLRAEEYLRKSEERLRFSFDNMLEGCIVIGFDWRFLYVNRSAARYGREKREDMVGRPLGEVHPGIETTPIYAGYRRCMEERTRQRFESAYTFPDGTTSWFEFEVAPVPEGIFALQLDVTERRRADEALRAASAYNRSLIEASLDPLVTIGVDGSITDVNAATEAVTGRPRSELIGSDFSDYFTEPERARAGYRQAFRDGSVQDYPLEIRRPDGGVTPVLYNASVYRAESGEVLGVFAAARDVTSIRRAESRLLSRERQLEILAEASRRINAVLDVPVIMRSLVATGIDLVGAASGTAGLLVDGKMVFREFNRGGTIAPIDYAFEAGAGVSGHVALTRGCYISNDAGSDARVDPGMREALGFRRLVNVPIVDRNGNLVGCFEIHDATDGRPFSDEDAAVLGGLAAAAAVALENANMLAERNRTAEHLLRLATAVGQAAEAIVITDVDGGILYINPAFESITGYSRAEVLGKNPRILKSGKQDEAFYRTLWTTILGGDVWSGTLVNRRKDGGLYEEQAVISPVRDPAGKVVNFVAVKRDVTRERQLESQLRRSQKMEAIGRLAGGVAHDFNNLLTATIGYCDLALHRIGEGHPLSRDLQEIRKASERCATLTRQLLAFSRKQILVPKVVNLNDIVADTDKLLRQLIGEDVELVAVRGDGLWNVTADPGQIEQVIVNLVVNSRDAMPRGGKVILETANVELDESYTRRQEHIPAGSYVMLAVGDTGCGMDESTLSQIFEPFFTTKEKGTGLGLSTVYGIVTQSGGYIHVYSEPGIGTTFKMYFPRVAQAASETVRPGGASRAEWLRGAETILVVEDDELVRKMVRRTLAQFGYEVLEARAGGEAIGMCSRQPGAVHLMLSDVVLPGMSGKELSEKLAPLEPGMKVLFMSGYTTDAIVHQGVLDPGVAFIQKPFSAASLAQKIREVLDSGSPTH